MTTSKGVIAIIAIIAAITTGSFLVGTGAAQNGQSRHKTDKVEARLAELEGRISDLEALLDVEPPESTSSDRGESNRTNTTDTRPPPHIREREHRDRGSSGAESGSESTPTTTTAAPQPAESTPAPAPAPAPAPSGGCSYPSGDPAGAQQIGDQRLSAGQTLENFVLQSGGNHAILPPNVSDTTVRNGSIHANGADNIKLGNNSRYQNLYLVMATSGAHLDAMQGQGASGVTVDNVTIVMQNHGGVTGAILFQSLLGGGGEVHRDITFDLNCVNIVGTGPYGHDIRIDYKGGADVTGRITNVSMSGNILITDRGGGGNCRIEVDASAMPHVNSNGCDIVAI